VRSFLDNCGAVGLCDTKNTASYLFNRSVTPKLQLVNKEHSSGMFKHPF
jgi:hypothetical protein